MNFIFLITSLILASTFVGAAFAEMVGEKEFTQEEIDKMKKTGVQLTTPAGQILIEFFPEDAPNTVHNFLELTESGYYNGVVFHRIIQGFMIQAGDPNTKDPESDKSKWGGGGPGYSIKQEFNTLQHDAGMVSMARSAHPDSAGSQFFIMHKDTPSLDAQYTVFGRVVPGTMGMGVVNQIAALELDGEAPIDIGKATITRADIIYPFEVTGIAGPERNPSIVKTIKSLTGSGNLDVYQNGVHDVKFVLPYRWGIAHDSFDNLNVVVEPKKMEHNVQQAIEKSGFVPKILIGSEERTPYELENDEVSTAFFSIAKGDEPKISSNYIFVNDDGRKAHLIISTQSMPDELDEEIIHNFKILQIHFNNEETNYSVIYVNLADWFRYEVNAFITATEYFEIMIDGKMQPPNFADSPVFRMVMEDAKEKPEPEALPPARIGGCLIATASYGSELAPQVQLLREMRDNTVLQTQSGILFMNGFNQFYYSFSPAIADYERESPIFKEMVKLTVTPLLMSLTLLQYADIDSEHEMLGYGIGVILLNIGMYFVAPAVLITKIRSFYKLQ